MNETTFFLAMAILLTFFGVIFATAGIVETIKGRRRRGTHGKNHVR